MVAVALTVAAAGCGGAQHATTTASPAPRIGPFERVLAAFARHGEPLALEPDLGPDDVWLTVGVADPPRPVAVLTRADGDTAVFVFRSSGDADTIGTLPRADLVFRARWRVLHGANLLVITVRPLRAVRAALADLGG